MSEEPARVGHREYEVFISYSRKDNEPDSTGKRWVTGIKDIIEEDSRAVQGREFGIFFDTSEIHGMQDWRARILGSLRTSKVMLVCLSPNYFASDNCRWEWEEYRKRQARVMARIGADDTDDGTIASVFFVEAPGSDPEVNAQWRTEVMRKDGVDLRPWFPDGATALALEDVQERVRGLGDDIWKRIERARRAETSVGNLMRFNPYFVGRTTELQALNDTLRKPGSIGVVTAVHGLGGLGKTELTVHYAHAYRDVYSGGVWLLRAEGHTDLLTLVATLADAPEFEFTPTPEIAKDPHLLGRAVLQDLRRRTRPMTDGTEPGAVLVVLDNVSEPALLAEPQLAQLPVDPHLRFVATTRLGERDFSSGRASLAFLPLDELAEQDGLTLIRDHQPARVGGLPDFADEVQEQAARDLVALLGGLTLAIEQAAIYLGAHPETTPADYLAGLMGLGLGDLEREVSADPDVSAEVRHQDRTVAAVLATTLAALDPPTRTTVYLASLMPPDTVPWPWLKDMLTGLHPEAIASFLHPGGGWSRIERTLSSRRLLTPTNIPEVARLHRVHTALLAPDAPPDLHTALRRHLVARARHINDGGDVQVWEYGALLDALIPLIPGDRELASELNLDADDSNFSDRIGEYVGDARPRVLTGLILPEIEYLADAQPGNLTTQRDLGIALNNVARLQQHTDPHAALELYQRSLDISEHLADAQPGNLTTQRDLGIALGNVARLQEATDPHAALELYQRSLDISEHLADAQPGNLTTQRDLGIALNNVARLQEATDPHAALELYQRSLDIREHLADAQPGNLTTQRDLGIALNNVARLQEATDPHAALELYQRSLDISEHLADAQPGNLTTQRDLGIALNNVARLQAATDPHAALELYQRSLDIREHLAEAQPGSSRFAQDLYRALWRCADATERLLGPPGAGTLWQRCWQLLRECEKRGWLPDPERWLLRAAAYKAGTDESFLDGWLRETIDRWPLTGESERPVTSASGMDPAILDEVGLGCLPEVLQISLMDAIRTELEMRVGTTLAAGLSKALQAEFEELMSLGDQAGALEWMARNVPDHQSVVRRGLDQIRADLRSRGAEIRSKLCND